MFLSVLPFLNAPRSMQTDREFSHTVEIPGLPGPSVVTRRNASEDPDQATAETVSCMRRAAIEDSNSPQVWGATRQAVANSSGREQVCRAIYQWIASQVQFRQDDPILAHVFGLDDELDLLIRPARLLTMRRPAEDCDGFTMLACAMLLCAEVPCEIVTIKADPQDPSRFTHVYCQAILEDGRGLVMDCSQGAQHGYPCGWEAPEYFDRRTWGVMNPTARKKYMHGLGESDDSESPWWQGLIRDVAKGGIDIARMQGTPVGYVQTPQMVANYGQGLNPAFGMSLGAGGIGSSTLLLGGGLLLAIVLLKK